MVYKGFIINVIIRLTLLVASLIAFTYLLIERNWVFTTSIIALFIITVILELFRFITKTNKDLSKFIDAINYQDYSVNFSSYKLGNAFDELHDSFKKTLQVFKELRLEKEAHYQYMVRLVKHIKLGIIAYNYEGKIILYNQGAQYLLELPNLVYWNRYESKAPHFYKAVANNKSNIKSLVNVGERELSVNSTKFLVDGKVHNVVVFQDLKSEIDDKEMDAWNKLIRLLTHEIMNSVTPIASLSDTLLTIEKNTETSNADIVEGLETINRRSQTLLKFVDDYRKLANVPAPNPKKVSAPDFFKMIDRLYRAEIESKGISFYCKAHATITCINIDESLIIKVFDNLVSNSIHALAGQPNPEIKIDLKPNKSGYTIDFYDNGMGVSSEKLGQIYVPFYSTKSTGTGIGLSLCRQIIYMHEGKLTTESEVGNFFKVSMHFQPITQ